MLEKRFSIEACAEDLEMARSVYSWLASSRRATEEEICIAAVEMGKLAVKLASARLAQAEFYLSSLVTRADYLKVRCESREAVKRDLAELAWIQNALPSNTTIIAELADEMEQRKRELEAILKQSEIAPGAKVQSIEPVQPTTRVARNQAGYQP
jgi:hypothetical protein